MSTMELLRTRVFLAGILALVVFSGVGAARLTYRHFRIEREIRSVAQEITDLQHERDQAEHSLASLNDVSAIERAAREKLNLQRAGEQVVVVVPSGNPESPADAQQQVNTTPKEPSNPEKWWAYFFGDAHPQ